MNFKSLLTPGIIAGVLAFIGTVMNAMGKPAVGAVLSDPALATNVQHGIDAVLAIFAGFAQGVAPAKPTTPPAA